MTTSPDGDRRALTPAWRGQRALGGLARLNTDAGPRLEIDARTLVRVDSFSGVMLKAAVLHHLASDPGHSVALHEPTDDDAWARLSDSVGSLPHRARWASGRVAAPRARDILLPATTIDDREVADLVGYWLGIVSAATRLPASESRLLQLAGATFADNALTHAPDETSIMGACRDPQGNDLQIVCFSPAEPSPDPRAYISDIAARSKRDLGGLAALDGLAKRRSIDATLRVAAGHGRLYSRGPHCKIQPDAPPVPGFATSLEIHLAG